VFLVCGKSAGPDNAIKHSYGETICSVINESRRWNLLAEDMMSFNTGSNVSRTSETDALNISPQSHKTRCLARACIMLMYALISYRCSLTSKRAHIYVCL
jgi:hypothetical protein